MKHLIFKILLCLCIVSAAGCSEFDDVALWNKSYDMDRRLKTVEEICDELNSNVSALRAMVNALQTNDYIRSISPVTDYTGKVVGYNVVFDKSGTITIYHGHDGKDGIDGNDGADGANGLDGMHGHTPQIAVKCDDDGIYYWTLDGEWLLDSEGNKVKAQGTDGKDGAGGSNGADGKDGINGADGKDGQNGADGKDGLNGADGKDGQNGADGKDGKDGITPQLKIEDGDWYISVDNGATWTNLGPATGADGQNGADGKDGQNGADGKDGINGTDGKDGKDGDSFFRSVDCTSSAEYVIFTLSNGEVIKIPTWAAFEALREYCNQLNTNINAIQGIVNALQSDDRVVSVTPVMESGREVGYTIVFSKSSPITIYHGRDGKDGQNGTDGKDGLNGADGHTPLVSVKKDTDGIYYWTLDGEWLLDNAGMKIKAQGVDGKDGKDGNDGRDGSDGKDGINGNDGKDGKDGINGADGKDGKDGITPQLKIEDGDLYISTDEGNTWTNLGRATGSDGKDGKDGVDGKDGKDGADGKDGQDGKDGKDGADGKDGDSFFISVTQNETSVTFTLSDGTEFTLPKETGSIAIKLSAQNDIEIILGRTISIDYTITGATNPDVDIFTETNSNWVVSITRETPVTGKINVLCNDYDTIAPVLLFASADNGPTSIVKLTFATPKGSIITYSTTDGKPIELTEYSVTNTSILSHTYSNGTGLIQFSGDLTEIGDGSHSWCSKNIRTLRLPETINVIKKNAFSYTSLEEVNFPASLKVVEDYAFAFTSLKQLYFEGDYLMIYPGAFYLCESLTKVDLSNVNKLDYNTTEYYKYNAGAGAFEDCKNLNEVKLGQLEVLGSTQHNSEIHTAAHGLFEKCTKLEHIDLPSGLKTIGCMVFLGCTGLKSIRFPESLEEIWMGAFLKTGLDCDLFIPNNVNYIGISAFKDCTSLKGHKLVIGYQNEEGSYSKLKYIGSMAFANYNNGENVGAGFSEIWVSTSQAPEFGKETEQDPFGDVDRPTEFHVAPYVHLENSTDWNKDNTTFIQESWDNWPKPDYIF